MEARWGEEGRQRKGRGGDGRDGGSMGKGAAKRSMGNRA